MARVRRERQDLRFPPKGAEPPFENGQQAAVIIDQRNPDRRRIAKRCHRWFEFRASSRRPAIRFGRRHHVHIRFHKPTTASRSTQRPRRIGLLVHPTRNLDEPAAPAREWTRAARDRHRPARDRISAETGRRRGRGERLRPDRLDRWRRHHARGSARRRGRRSSGARDRVWQPRSAGERDVPRSAPRARAVQPGPVAAPTCSRRCRSRARRASRCSPSTMWRWYAPAAGRSGSPRRSTGRCSRAWRATEPIVSTPIGTSGYAISAGGPLLLTHVDGYVFTPLPKHGGFAPPLVIASESELTLEVAGSFAGARLEIDGQVAGDCAGAMTITFKPGGGDAGELRRPGVAAGRAAPARDPPRQPATVAEADRDARQSARGKLTATSRPPSARGAVVRRAPWASTIASTIDRPSPRPWRASAFRAATDRCRRAGRTA